MPRSIWSGAISFGLVNVPVKLYSAVSKKTVRFNQLHEADGARIQQKRVCSKDGEEVSYEDPYYLAPDTGAAKAYKLLLAALKETNKVAIARVVIRSNEYLTAIRPA